MEPLSHVARLEILDRYHQIWGVPMRANRNPAPQPVSLGRHDLATLASRDYMVADKSDGTRVILFLTEAECQPIAVLVDRRLELTPVPVAASKGYFRGTIFDGELVWTKTQPATRLLLIFDVVAIRGNSVGSLPFTERSALIRETFDLQDSEVRTVEDAHSLAKQGKILAGATSDGLSFRPKTCFHLSMIGTLLRSVAALPYATDGLIFTPIHEPVRTGTHRTLFKLKQHHTVDVQCWPGCRRVALGMGGGPETATHRVDLGEAAPGIAISADFWARAEVLGVRDNSILECFLKGDPLCLTPEKLRIDKDHPNTAETLRRTASNVREAISAEEVLDVLSSRAGNTRP